ncbi:TetR family transcriptional regulator [Herbihabitans rhizosphaerae]|uniref:TetR family transcriptional regulator n=1 Tax=Herbihabitans rhizosphaerae TaxID=1872711 RepID=A0A4Q7KJ94_9PSEU|nr:TetR family transcriptional regulator [Herbihabitans rhizosphaerae]RZS34305.1 TetR family transcriptional regulator [Herbihabitans rhizosphaerae]
MARPGRRPGQTETRERILAAARKQFGERGYTGATIRSIAAEAEVNPALLHHFFGSKDQVFVEALQLPINPDIVVGVLTGGPREQAGERMVRLFLSLFASEQARQPVLAILRSATQNEQAARMMRGFLERVMLARVSEALGISTLRVSGMAGQIMGLMLLRYVVCAEPIASASEDEIVAMVAPVLQQYIDAPA